MAEPNIYSGEVVMPQLWSPPCMEEGAAPAAQSWRMVNEIKTLEQDAMEQAKAQGHAAGLLAAQSLIDAKLKDLDTQIQRFRSALDALARPLALMDSEVQEQLSELAIYIASQLLRRELKIDPSQVIAVVRETVALLPAAARDVRVQLHPEDAALLRERLAAPQVESAWTILEDAMMSRGGCRVTAEAAQIDARIETRLAAVVSALLGDERAQERSDAKGETLP